MTDSSCGSNAGYARHRRAKEDACRPCKDAHNQDAKRRGLGRDQTRAMRELRERHLDEYRAILQEIRTTRQVAEAMGRLQLSIFESLDDLSRWVLSDELTD